MAPFRYCGYVASVGEPNVVIDGSPNEATVLTLTHWPGYPQPPGFHFDLSAEMAFHSLDQPIGHPVADAVTNNHYDQDGLVGLHALIEPELSLAHRQLLIDVAAAGDFGTYRDRRAARASMTISAYSDGDRSPLADRLVGSYDEQCVVLYEATIPLLVSMAVDNERFRDLWAEEDEELTASEAAIAEMRPLADRLTGSERHSATWTASAPGSLTPTMRVEGESSLDQSVVRGSVIGHLREAPPAWDPYIGS